MFEVYQVFLLKAAALGLATVLTIPKEDYRRLFGYGLVLGTLMEVVIVFLLNLFGLAKYANMGPYNILGFISFWTPLAWGFAFMLYLRFLPMCRMLLYPYIAGWVWLSYSLGRMLENLDVFRHGIVWHFTAPLLFALWYAFSAWCYIRAERIELR